MKANNGQFIQALNKSGQHYFLLYKKLNRTAESYAQQDCEKNMKWDTADVKIFHIFRWLECFYKWEWLVSIHSKKSLIWQKDWWIKRYGGYVLHSNHPKLYISQIYIYIATSTTTKKKENPILYQPFMFMKAVCLMWNYHVGNGFSFNDSTKITDLWYHKCGSHLIRVHTNLRLPLLW